MWKTIIILILGLCTSGVSYAQYASDITVETLLKTDTTSVGQRIIYPNVDRAEITVLKITMNSGASTGWHKHGIPLFAYIIQGELTIERENGQTNIMKAGQALSEMIHIYHQGTNTGKEPTVLVAFYLGGDDKPLVHRKEN